MTDTEKQTPEELWESFWKWICVDDQGRVNIEQVKKELHDFHFMMLEVPKVYDHVTGSTLSKPMYHASAVIKAADEHYQETHETFQEEAIEMVKEEIFERIEDAMQTEGTDLDRVSIRHKEWQAIKNEFLGQR